MSIKLKVAGAHIMSLQLLKLHYFQELQETENAVVIQFVERDLEFLV